MQSRSASTIPHDPRVAPIVDIRERDLAGRQGRFVAEGKVVLNVLFSARRFEAESVLVLENRLAGLAETLRLAPAVDAGLCRLAARSWTPSPASTSIAASSRSAESATPTSREALIAALPAARSCVVLVGISNHDNIGAIFRNAAAFGADAVLLDETCCDPLYRKAIRVSVGAALKVPFAVAGDAGSTRRACWRARGFGQFALSPRGAIDIRDASRAGPAGALSRHRRRRPAGALLSRLQTVRIAHGARLRQPQRRRRLGDRPASLQRAA